VGAALLGGIAAAMVGSVFSSDAWNNVTFIQVNKKPQKNIVFHFSSAFY
jgi:APA family basic amino acid/polyamine antiporter